MTGRRWRPPLILVLAGALWVTLAASFAGLVALRYLGPEIGFRSAALCVGVLILAATGLIGWLQLRLLLRPIRAVEAYATAAERGEPALPPPHFGTQELHATAQRVISMAATLRDREASVRSFTDHVTHELKTPVSAIRAAVELMQDGGTLSPGDARLLAQIDGARCQLEAQLSALRTAARARETRYLGRSTLAAVEAQLRERFQGLQIVTLGAAESIRIGPEGLVLILGHLLQNAQENGARTVTLGATSQDGTITLTVVDDGIGLPDRDPQRVFEPFFTTRRDAGGTGMGLSIVRNLLAAHGADIATGMQQSGAAFCISFPADRTIGNGQSHR